MVQNCFKIISRQRKKYTPAEPPPLKSDLFLKPSQNVLKGVVYFLMDSLIVFIIYLSIL